MTEERKKFIREQAIIIQELTKGFTIEPTDNAMKACLEMTNYVLELTDSETNLIKSL